MALEMFPPPMLLSFRFLLSGGILLVACKWMNLQFPPLRTVWRSAGNGLMTLGVANGCVTFAETWVPSGLVALFITTAPFWMTGLEAAVPGGQPLHWPAVAGMAVGFSGVALLVGPDVLGHASQGLLSGFLLLQFSNFSWSLGSILQRRLPRDANSVVTGAIQQFSAGLAFLLPALVTHQAPIHFSWRSVGALCYLIVFGSIIGYSAYIYALDRLPVSVVSIFTYINPVIAVALGWLVYREPFGFREAGAMGVIFLGVWLVKRWGK
jgi:drug/metabolite transporter (DMT)-like permease